MTMDTHTKHVQLPAHAEAAATARNLISDWARVLDCMSPAGVDDLGIAVGETFANIVMHGECGADDPVLIKVMRRDASVRVSFDYLSAPFDPDPVAPNPEDFATGGYGLFIVRTLMDNVDVEFSGGRAYISIEKRC